MVTLTIDGKMVNAPEDATVLVAARTVGIKIPTLCYHPRLSNYGGCRLCVVEIRGIPRPVTACTTPVSEGMEVLTSTPEIESLRRTIIELILSDHPTECPRCEQSGNCTLQDVAYLYGGFENRFKGDVASKQDKVIDPFISRDMKKCILCGRCVRVCHELQGVGAIDFTFRGFKTQIDTPYGQRLRCEYCGQCISVCPTGALTGTMWEFKGWQKDAIDTVCPFCGTGCNITLHVKDDEIIRVTSNDNSWNEGLLCLKGRFGYKFVNSPERLKKPLIRIKDKGPITLEASLTMPYKERLEHFREASWHEAIEFIASKLRSIKADYGPDSIGGLSSARCTNEENYLFQKFLRAAVATNNIDQCERLCHVPSTSTLANILGSSAMTNSIEEIAGLEVIFIIGSNTKETHPVIANRMIDAYRKGSKLIVADPRNVPMSRFAEVFLKHRVGTDVALLNAMARVIVDESLYNAEFIDSNTEGFHDWKASLEDYTPEQAERITGVDKNKIIKSARLYGSSRNAGIFYSTGLTHHTCGVDNVSALANLVLLTGNIGRRSTGLNPLKGQNNVQGAADAGCSPLMLPGYQKVSNPALRAKFEYVWECKIPTQPGMNVIEMFDAAHEGRLKALYIMGGNPILSAPNTHHVLEALKNLHLFFVQDIFLTETAFLADVILPAASFAEKDGTFTNTDRRVQRVRKALKPPGEARPDLEILLMLSNSIGYKMRYKNVSEVWTEYGRLWPAIAGIQYSRIDKRGIQWPCPTKDHPGTRFLYQGGFPRGKAPFTKVAYTGPAALQEGKHTFVLTTGKNLFHYQSGSMTRRVKDIEDISGTPYVEINKADMVRQGINDGDLIKVFSKWGSLSVRAKMVSSVPEGTLFMPIHYAESCANILTNHDDMAKYPAYKAIAVGIEPFEEEIDKDELIARLQEEIRYLNAEIEQLRARQANQ